MSRQMCAASSRWLLPSTFGGCIAAPKRDVSTL